MTRHRILVVGAPAAGKAWLASRIHALTGMPVIEHDGRIRRAADRGRPRGEFADARPAEDAQDASEPGGEAHASGEPAERHEWVAIARDRARADALLPRADLVVLVRTPRVLRQARTVLRWLSSLGRPGWTHLRRALRATGRYDADELPALTALLAPHRARVVECRSSEDVRAVLECIFGLTSVPAPRA